MDLLAHKKTAPAPRLEDVRAVFGAFTRMPVDQLAGPAQCRAAHLHEEHRRQREKEISLVA